MKRCKNAAFFATIILLLADMIIPVVNGASMAENAELPGATGQLRVERIDENTGEIVTLKVDDCKKLGDKSTMVPTTLSVEEELDIWLERSQRSYDKLKDYTAVFYKRERVNGKLLPEERVRFKFRKPFMVYMKWVGEINTGQECLYVKGKHGNKLLARGTGLKSMVSVKLDPEGKIAMSGIRHPITEAGIGHLIDLLRKDRALAAKHGEGKVFNRGKDRARRTRKSGAPMLQKFTCILPKDTRPEYYCHRAEVAFDVELGLPVSISIYDGANNLLERYRYENLKLNMGLTDKDFDKDNDVYRL